MFTLHQTALAPARKPYRTGLLSTHKNGDFGTIFCSVRSRSNWNLEVFIIVF